MSCFQSSVVALRTVYPNAVVWSEENLVAVACVTSVIILNPHNPKVRGVITVPSSKRFPTGKIVVDGGGLANYARHLETMWLFLLGCSILAVGGKCGKILLWRVRAPEYYSTDNAGHSSEVRLVGLEKTHDSWITAISWVGYGSNDSKTQFALDTESSDGCVKIWLVNGENLLKASEVIDDSLSLLREVATVDSSMIYVLSLTVPTRSPSKLFLAIGKSSGSYELCTLDTSTGEFDNVGCYNAHDS
ncbi:hypothetical protein SASPL_150506 [Salvia splendens]|uniref:Uncharacterized protein n=1 Tax=Salvia splendens TaxID=180675 RepID=A0A8X8W667_SALSN|nr:hypothetical protein SASPL_150506 [Salvia splendens]